MKLARKCKNLFFISILTISLTASVTPTFALNGIIGDNDTIKNPDEVGMHYYESAPEGFNPLNATNEELEQYGFLSKPTEPNEIKFWEQSLKAEIVKSKVKLRNSNKRNENKDKLKLKDKLELNDTQNTTYMHGSNWAGYARDSYSNSTVQKVSGKWKIPTAAANVYTYTSESNWLGIGGTGNYANDYLYQAGSESNWNNAWKEYSLWYEVVGGDSDTGYALTLTGLPASAGDEIYCQVWMNPNFNTWVGGSYFSHKINFYVYNVTKGKISSFWLGNNDYGIPSKTAEWIAERPTKDTGGFTLLSNFGTTQFYSCMYSPTWSGSNYLIPRVDSMNLNWLIDMYTPDGTKCLAWTNALSADGVFTIDWRAYQ